MKGSFAVSVLFLAGCGVAAPTAPDPETYNETYMIAQVVRIERAMNIGAFEVWFQEPPQKTYAGWAYCGNGNTPPFRIGFNKNMSMGCP